MDRTELEQDVRQALSVYAQMPADAIRPDAHLTKDLPIDSLSRLELIAELEVRFDIELTNDELSRMTTLNGIVDVLLSRAKEPVCAGGVFISLADTPSSAHLAGNRQ